MNTHGQIPSLMNCVIEENSLYEWGKYQTVPYVCIVYCMQHHSRNLFFSLTKQYLLKGVSV